MGKSEFNLPKHHYRAINVTPAKNIELSPGAKGIMYYLLTQKNTWKGQVYDMVNNMNASEKVIKKYVKELVNAGYLTRIHVMKDGLFKGSYYEVNDELLSN